MGCGGRGVLSFGSKWVESIRESLPSLPARSWGQQDCAVDPSPCQRLLFILLFALSEGAVCVVPANKHQSAGSSSVAILLASLPSQLEGKAVSGMEKDKSMDPGFPLLAHEEAHAFCEVAFGAFQLSSPILPTRRPLLALLS